MKPRLHARSRGFTLLEIMVALALLAVIVVAIYSTWFSIVKGSTVAAKAAAAGQRSRIAMSTVLDSLLCSCMYSQNGRYYAFVASADGDYSDLSFTAHLPSFFLRSRKFGGAEVRRLNFTVEDGPDSKKELVLRQNLLLMDPDKDEMENPVVLARDVTQFIIEFTDPKTGDWTSEWDDTNQLPAKVRVTLTLGDKYSDKPQETMIGTVALVSHPVPGIWQVPMGPLNSFTQPPGTQSGAQSGTQQGGQQGTSLPGNLQFGPGGMPPGGK